MTEQLQFLPPTHRRKDWDTSTEAGKKPRDTQRQKVLYAFRTNDPDGSTDYEISEVTGILRGTVAKRRQELVELGLIESTELRRYTDSGSRAIVWRTV